MPVSADETVGNLAMRDTVLTPAGIEGFQGLYRTLFIAITDFDQWLP